MNVLERLMLLRREITHNLLKSRFGWNEHLWQENAVERKALGAVVRSDLGKVVAEVKLNGHTRPL